MKDSNDLWPDFDQIPIVKSPRAVLLEQANFLSQRTKNLLSVSINTGTSSDAKIMNKFAIVAPLLNNYTFVLLSLYHGPINYPCEIKYQGKIISVTNEIELRLELKGIFNTEETKRIISSLYSQSKEVSEPSF